jgi:hypothetical protein
VQSGFLTSVYASAASGPYSFYLAVLQPNFQIDTFDLTSLTTSDHAIISSAVEVATGGFNDTIDGLTGTAKTGFKIIVVRKGRRRGVKVCDLWRIWH